MSPAADAETPSRWAAFQNRAFMLYWLSRLASGFAVQIQTVAVGWQVYDITRNPLDLGFVGLSQFAPALLLVLVTGAVADRYRRRSVMAVCLAVEML
ncbi:MAG: MFS transporter, partial [Propylenella sp.]